MRVQRESRNLVRVQFSPYRNLTLSLPGSISPNTGREHMDWMLAGTGPQQYGEPSTETQALCISTTSTTGVRRNLVSTQLLLNPAVIGYRELLTQPHEGVLKRMVRSFSNFTRSLGCTLILLTMSVKRVFTRSGKCSAKAD